jgi:hypothetical protein
LIGIKPGEAAGSVSGVDIMSREVPFALGGNLEQNVDSPLKSLNDRRRKMSNPVGNPLMMEAAGG